MGVRNEAVRLSLIDDFTTPMAKAVVATRAMDSALEDLDGNAVRAKSSTSALAKSDGLPAVERSAASSGREVDRLSGRLRILVDTAAALGPALVPLSAGAVGGLAGVTSQLGAAGAATAVAILAISGLGDGLSALNDYQLEPTQANLEKVNEEFRKAGPAGRQFLLYLDSIEPQLRSLQMASRAGFLPGAEEGIDQLLTALPQLRRYIRDVSTTLGGLAADAGADLVGPDWEPFFEFVRADGIVLLDQFARSAGNLGQGLANMLAGFSPASRDFSDGLLGMTERFADWSTTLDDNASFQEFVDYVRSSGPQAIAFLGSFVDALTAVAVAAAPIGDVTLPILTGVLDVLSTLAGSDLGTPLLAAAAGLAALNRATQGMARMGGSNLIQKNYVTPIKNLRAAAPAIGQVGTYLYRMGQDADRASAKTLAARSAVRGFTGQLGGLGRGAALIGGVGLAASGLADNMGLSNAATMAMMGTIAGPWGAAVLGATGLAMDLAAANRDVDEAVQAADDALRSMSAANIERELDRITKKIADVEDDIRTDSFGEFFSNMFDPDVLSDFTREAFGMETQTDRLRQKQEDLRSALASGGSEWRQLLAVPGDVAREFDVAAQSLDDFAASFTALNQLLDDSGSLVNYERAIDSLTESLKESGSFNVDFESGRQNIEGLNGILSKAIERSQALKEAGDNLGSVRILERARADLLAFGEDNEKAMRWIRPMIRELDDLSNTTAEPKVKADDSDLDSKVKRSNRRLNDLHARLSTAVITGDVQGLLSSLSRGERRLLGITNQEWKAILRGDIGNALSAINSVRGAAEAAAGTYTVRLRTVREGSGFGPQRAAADGTTVPKTGLPYADRHLYLLADGEEVTSNRHGQADAFRDVLKGINAGWSRRTIKGMLADGGTAGGNQQIGTAATLWTGGANAGLLTLRDRLRDATRAVEGNTRSVDKERRQRDAAVSRRDELAGTASSGLRSDLFAAPDNAWSAGANASPGSTLDFDISRGREIGRLVKVLRSKGLDGPALAELVSKAIENNDVTLLRTYADMPRSALAGYEKKYELRDQVLASVGAQIGNAAYGADVREQTRELREAKTELRQSNQRLDRIEKAIKAADKGNRDGHNKNADQKQRSASAARDGSRRAPQ